MKLQIACCLLVSSVLIASCRGTSSSAKIWYINRLGTYLPNITVPIGQIITLECETSQDQVIVQSPPAHFLEDGKFSPDGSYIVYTSDDDDSRIHLWLAKQDGSNVKEIAQASDSIRTVWLTNTQLLVLKMNKKYATSWLNDGEAESYDILSQQTHPLVLKTNIGLFGKPLVADNQPEKVPLLDQPQVGLAHLKTEGDTVVQVPDLIFDLSNFAGFSELRFPSLTADGKNLAFVGRLNLHTDQIFLTADNGRTVNRLTTFEDNYGGVTIFAAGISPNGKWIIFSANLYKRYHPNFPEGVTTGLLNTESKTVEFLTVQESRGNFAWSPDGRYAAISLVPLGKDPQTTNGEIHLIDIANRQIKQLTSDGGMKEVIGWR